MSVRFLVRSVLVTSASHLRVADAAAFCTRIAHMRNRLHAHMHGAYTYTRSNNEPESTKREGRQEHAQAECKRCKRKGAPPGARGISARSSPACAGRHWPDPRRSGPQAACGRTQLHGTPPARPPRAHPKRVQQHVTELLLCGTAAVSTGASECPPQRAHQGARAPWPRSLRRTAMFAGSAAHMTQTNAHTHISHFAPHA